MNVVETALPGVRVLHPAVHVDGRGHFTEVWRTAYDELGIGPSFAQDNHSRSRRGVIRGMHWQRQHPQGKLVSVIRGEILDVVADVRPGSPTEGVVVTVPMTVGVQVWVPPGYAHGFVVRSEVADVLYKCTDTYHPGDAYGLRWDDPFLGIDWGVDAPVLSEADAALPVRATIDEGHLPPWP